MSELKGTFPVSDTQLELLAMKPILQLYRGYANEEELIVMGHVFKRTYDYDFQKKNFKNASSIINQFRIKTLENFDVYEAKKIS